MYKFIYKNNNNMFKKKNNILQKIKGYLRVNLLFL